MSNLKDKILEIRTSFEKNLNNITDVKNLENLRVEFLGKNGLITQLLGEMKNLSLEDKKEFGPIINQLRSNTEEELKLYKENLIKKEAEAKIYKQQNFDVTADKTNEIKGHLHPYSQFIEEIENIFISMGYQVFDGPEVETDYYNFTALNIPSNHPARDMHDTFWLNKTNMLLRTHTSTTQIRTMEKEKLPIAGIVTGRTFRHEAVDASHDFMFMQCEGMYIDKNVTLSNLFATAQKFLKTLFKKETLDIRIRPGFFPFVEPGVEIDMRCPFCKNGCSVCKKSTWIEVFPAGLIHPNVLKAGGIDPEKYSGFAFGFGLTRLAMLKYGINDIRHLYGGKIKFLEQF